MKKIIKKEYDEMPFDIITRSEILTRDDFADLLAMSEELKETFTKVQMFRTRTEMEISVLNDIKHPTPASKYWQAVREQNTMFNEMVMLSYEYRKNIVEIQILDKKIENEKDELERELLRIEKEKKIFISKNQERTAKARMSELKEWSDIKQREARMMSEDELGNVDNHQLISYVKRWIKQSIIMGGTGSPAERQNLQGQLRSGILLCVSKGILDSVTEGFPEDVRKKINEEYKL
ncbi:MAG: hypothetical protein WC766_06495 [Patescibacteria group bacterium]|jgi:uncharacterized protein YfiM (DUF2279 family)